MAYDAFSNDMLDSSSVGSDPAAKAELDEYAQARSRRRHQLSRLRPSAKPFSYTVRGVSSPGAALSDDGARFQQIKGTAGDFQDVHSAYPSLLTKEEQEREALKKVQRQQTALKYTTRYKLPSFATADDNYIPDMHHLD